MMRFLMAGLMAAALAAASAPAATAGESFTTRIEPRPFYGATVTIEAGVRVFRPLPPTRHMVINPNNATPLNLSYSDVRETRESHNYYYDRRGGSPPVVYGGSALAGGDAGYRGRRFKRPRSGAIGPFPRRGHRHAYRGGSHGKGGSRH